MVHIALLITEMSEETARACCRCSVRLSTDNSGICTHNQAATLPALSMCWYVALPLDYVLFSSLRLRLGQEHRKRKFCLLTPKSYSYGKAVQIFMLYLDFQFESSLDYDFLHYMVQTLIKIRLIPGLVNLKKCPQKYYTPYSSQVVSARGLCSVAA